MSEDLLEVYTLRQALVMCVARFLSYEDHHRNKNSADGFRKARTNGLMADLCVRALRAGIVADEPPVCWRPMDQALKDNVEIIYLHKDGFVSSCKWQQEDDGQGERWFDGAISEEVAPLGWIPMPYEVGQPAAVADGLVPHRGS